MPTVQKGESAETAMRRALALHGDGDVAAALFIYDDLLLRYPHHPQLLYNAALANIAQKSFALAEEQLIRSLEARPDLEPARRALLGIWATTRQWQLLDQLVDGPSWFVSITVEERRSIALSLRQEGLPRVAVLLLENIVLERGNDSDAFFELGQCLKEMQETSKAVEALRAAWRLKPEPAIRAIALVQCLLELHLEFKRPEIWAEAESVIAAACKIWPDDSACRILHGQMAEDIGDFDSARASYGLVASTGENLAALTSLLALTDGEPAAERAEQVGRLALDVRYSPQERSRAFQVLGKYADRCGDHARAFDLFSKAKAIAAAGRRFDSNRHFAYVESLRRTYQSAQSSSAGFGDPDDRRPCFIIGMPRSGTTLLEQMLARHPQICPGGEIGYFPGVERAGRALHDSDGNATGFKSRLDRESHIRTLAREYLDLLEFAGSDASRVVDKMPFNFLQVGTIMSVFPNCRIIHCSRHPLDVVISCFIEAFSDDYPFSWSIEDIANYVVAHQQIMAHWYKIFPDHIMSFHYEDLITGPELQMRRAIEHLGLEWNNACLQPSYDAAPIRTPSKWQVRQPLYSSSVQRWKKYASQLSSAVEILSCHGVLTDVAR